MGSRRNLLAFTVFLGLGVALTAGVALRLQSVHDDRRESELREEFKEIVDKLAQEVAVLETIGSGTRAFFHLAFAGAEEAQRLDPAGVATPPVVSGETFHLFNQELVAARPEIQLIAWVPRLAFADRADHERERREEGFTDYALHEVDLKAGRLVPAGTRAEYFPLTYMEPFRPTALGHGFDFGAHPAGQAALTRAAESGAPEAHPTVPMSPADLTNTLLPIFFPVYAGGAVPAGAAERSEQLVGFVVLTLDVSGLMHQTLQGLNAAALFEITIRGESILGPDFQLYSAGTGQGEAGGPSLAAEVDVAASTWSVSGVPTAAFTAGLPLRIRVGGPVLVALIWLALGLAVTALLRERRRRVEVTSARRRLAGILDTAPDAIISADSQRRIRLFNRGAEATFGYSAAEVNGRPLDMLVPGSRRDSQHAGLHAFMASAETARYIREEEGIRGRRKDGSEFPAEASVSRLDLPDGPVFTAILRDVTERSRAAEALRQSEASLARAQEIAHLGSWEWDLATDDMRWSDETYRILGEEPQKSPPAMRTFLAHVLPADRDRVQAIIQGAIDRREGFALQTVVIVPDGTERVVYAQGRVLHGKEDRPVRMIGAVQDITERVHAEEALRQSEASLAHAQEIAHLGSWEWDLATDDMRWSDETYRIFGTQSQEFPLSHDDAIALVHPAEREQARAAHQAAVDRREAFAHRTTVIRADGTERVVYTQGEPILDKDGRPVQLIGTVRDITEQVHAEAERTRLLEEKQQLVQRLFQSQEAERKRVASELHDGPIQWLAGAGMFLDSFVAERQKGDVESAERYLQLAREHLDTVLADTRRIMAGLRPGDLDDVGLVEAIRGLLKDTQERTESEIEFRATMDGVRLDPAAELALYRIAQEGTANAIRHSGSPKIRVVLAVRDADAVLEIRDWGQGFDAAARAPDWQRGQHVGLIGMRERAELAGGVFRVDSTPLHGTTVHVRIPLNGAPATVAAPAEPILGTPSA